MKISKSSMQDSDLLISLNKFNHLSSEDIKHIQSFAESITDDDMVNERDAIEQCASSNKTYYYNSNWNSDIVKQIKEYASICKCVTSGVNPKDDAFVKTAKTEETMIKQASVAVKEDNKLSEALANSFHLNDEFDDSGFKKNKSWEKVTAESKLSSPSVANTQHSIIGVGGGEDYLKSNHLFTRRGQNSVTDPDAIKSIIENKEVDSGVKMRNERKEMESKRKSEIVASEKKLVQDAEEKGFGSMSAGSVKMTESLNAQPGIRGKDAFGFLDAVEKTAGEGFADKSKLRKEAIQRPVVKDERDWDKPQEQATHVISDIFTETLKAKLSSIKK